MGLVHLSVNNVLLLFSDAEVTDTTEWLTCSAKSKDVWALESVLQCVSPSSVLKYKWILDFNQKQAQKTLQRLPHFDVK